MMCKFEILNKKVGSPLYSAVKTVSEKIVSLLVILSMETAMVAKVISELSPFLDLRIFQKPVHGTLAKIVFPMLNTSFASRF